MDGMVECGPHLPLPESLSESFENRDLGLSRYDCVEKSGATGVSLGGVSAGVYDGVLLSAMLGKASHPSNCCERNQKVEETVHAI